MTGFNIQFYERSTVSSNISPQVETISMQIQCSGYWLGK